MSGVWQSGAKYSRSHGGCREDTRARMRDRWLVIRDALGTN